ncbi:MAG: hypothetical protein WCG28_02980 [bacterium]
MNKLRLGIRKVLLLVAILVLIIGVVYVIRLQKIVEVLPLGETLKNIPDNISITKVDDRPYIKYTVKDYFNIDLVKERLYEYFPKDMADFLYYYRECQFIGGEVGSGNPEQEEMLSKLAQSYCIDFKSIEKTIEKKYLNNPKLQDMVKMQNEIDSSNSLNNYSFLWNDPKRESGVLNKYIEAKAQYVLETVKEQMQGFDVLVANNADSKKLDAAKYGLGVQKSYLDDVLYEIDRLHPITRKEIETLRDNKEFIKRAIKI